MDRPLPRPPCRPNNLSQVSGLYHVLSYQAYIILGPQMPTDSLSQMVGPSKATAPKKRTCEFPKCPSDFLWPFQSRIGHGVYWVDGFSGHVEPSQGGPTICKPTRQRKTSELLKAERYPPRCVQELKLEYSALYSFCAAEEVLYTSFLHSLDFGRVMSI